MIRTRKKGWILLNQIPLLDEYRREGGKKSTQEGGERRGGNKQTFKEEKRLKLRRVKQGELSM